MKVYNICLEDKSTLFFLFLAIYKDFIIYKVNIIKLKGVRSKRFTIGLQILMKRFDSSLLLV